MHEAHRRKALLDHRGCSNMGDAAIEEANVGVRVCGYLQIPRCRLFSFFGHACNSSQVSPEDRPPDVEGGKRPIVLGYRAL